MALIDTLHKETGNLIRAKFLEAAGEVRVTGR